MGVGSLLPWASASYGPFHESVSGIEGGDGWLVIALAVAPLVFAIRKLASRARVPAIATIVLGAIALVVALFEIADASSKVDDFNENVGGSADADVGLGLFLVLVGAGLLLAGGIVARVRQDRGAVPLA
jgi:hypothetical protein